MSNDSEIRPALTAEQWEGITLPSGTFLRDIEGAGATDESITVGDGFDSVEFSGERRHALAALALYGQPFGFTHADLELLRDAAGAMEAEGHEHHRYEEGARDKARCLELASRLAALLPPEGATSA